MLPGLESIPVWQRTVWELIKEKRFYNRSTNSAAFCALPVNVFQPLFFATQIIKTFVNSRISDNHEILILFNVPLV